jgi:hypothetical protein
MSSRPEPPSDVGDGLSPKDFCQLLHKKPENMAKPLTVGLFMVHASWNRCPPVEKVKPLLNIALQAQSKQLDYIMGSILVDHQSEEDLEICVGDNHACDSYEMPCPPESLPALALTIQGQSSTSKPKMMYLTSLTPFDIMHLWKNPNESFDPFLLDEIQQHILDSGVRLSHWTPTIEDSSSAVRIFVAGDRMSVGKSSVCLGLLGSLIAKGYPSSSLAYIKPATQNEKPQLVEKYCKKLGIACVPVGPVVYYRGFTRAFLAGDTDTTSELLQKVEEEVDKVARNKRVVVVDGVGFPAVGSICGTDNASVARASGYPSPNGGSRRPPGVLLVGGSGVGSAVDAFNLNATYFEAAQVPVLGALFNKLSMDGFYSLENCKTQITSYFDQNAHQLALGKRPFGFVPLCPGIAGEEGMQHVDEFLRIFNERVDVDGLLQAATKVQQQQQSEPTPVSKTTNGHRTIVNKPPSPPPAKRRKVEYMETRKTEATRTRQEIERAAIKSGAAPSA